MSERRVKLVAGYHPETPPPEGARGRFPSRFAVVLDSYRPGALDMVFDDALFVAFLRTLADVVAADHVEAHLEPPPSGLGRRRAPTAPLAGVQSLSDHYARQPAVEREPPALVRFRRGPELVAVGTSELWARVGGPDPYHDSYTFSLFSDLADPAPLVSACTTTAQHEGAHITDVIRARSSWQYEPGETDPH